MSIFRSCSIAIIATCFVLTGCSKDLDEQSDRAEIEKTPSETQLPDLAPSDTSNEPTPDPVELSDEEEAQAEDLLGWDSKPGIEALQSLVATEIDLLNLREEYIAECMRSEGFEYVALLQDFAVTIVEDPDIARGTSEWVETYGFGTTTLSFPQDLVEPEGIGFDPAWLGAGPPGSEDNPNSSYYNSLDTGGQEAYDTSLLGGDGAGGCHADALLAVPNRQELTRETLADELHDLDERVKASAEHSALASELSECMKVPDFTFTGYETMQETIDRKLRETGLSSTPNGPELAINSEDEEPAEALSMGSPEWIEALVAVQELEVLLATEFERCIGTDQFFERYETIAKPYRDEFLSSNHAVLLSLSDS